VRSVQPLERLVRVLLLRWLLLPAAVILILTFSYSLRIQREGVEASHVRDAVWVRAFVQVYLDGVGRFMDMVYVDGDGRVDPRSVTTIAPGPDGSPPLFYRLLVLDRDDRLLYAYPANREIGADLSGVIESATEGPGITLTAPYYSTAVDAIVVSAVRAAGRGGYRIVAELNLGVLQREVESNLPASGDAVVFVTDRYGNIIAHPETRLVEQQVNVGDLPVFRDLQPGEPSTDVARMDGRAFLQAAVQDPASGWVVVVAEPAATAFAPVAGVFLATLVALFALSVVMLFVFRRNIVRRIVRPLRRFAATLDQDPARGDPPVPLEGYFAELDTLVLRYAEMAERVAQREEALVRAAGEKEVLLREIHHRVKNNLNVIASLLSLQSGSVDSVGAARAAFDESKNRIHSIARVHESLYGGDDFSSVNMDSYVADLVGDLRVNYDPAHRIRVNIDVDRVDLGIEFAVPCGIILNEILTNAYKHAFPEGRTGEITVRFGVSEPDHYRLEVSDDGVGIPGPGGDGFRDGHGSLGRSLIEVLVNQIDGSMEVDTGAGTRYTVTWRGQGGDGQ